MYPDRVKTFSRRALDWLEVAPLTSIKEASQAVRALCMWEHNASDALAWLQQTRSGDHWEGDNHVRNTARVCIALSECGRSRKDSAAWLHHKQLDDGSWNNNVYDTCYCLIALGALGEKNPAGVQWLLDNFSKDREHPGVIALINSALMHQDPGVEADTISRNSSWLLAQCTDNHWKYPATSCLVVQSLILDGQSESLERSVSWLLDRMEGAMDAEWKVSEVALVLITLRMYYIHHKDML
ncbi:MAG: hypothetical protein M8349_03605 [ANME-2 cluster archaeon]|nr:hypothetical protein [ANME-2 cluster archaeon]